MFVYETFYKSEYISKVKIKIFIVATLTFQIIAIVNF